MGKDIKAVGKALPNGPSTFIVVKSETGKSVEAMINPKEIAFSKGVEWAPQGAAGLDFPDLQFTKGKAITLSLELMFDKYESDGDVRPETNTLVSFAMRDENLHRPPTVTVMAAGPLFGGDNFVGVVNTVKVRYTMFNVSGTPVRAVVTLDMQQADKDMITGNSPDVAKQRVVKRGETLQLIAESEYQNAGEWRRIADANGIDDPLSLEPGTKLLIPPIL